MNLSKHLEKVSRILPKKKRLIFRNYVHLRSRGCEPELRNLRQLLPESRRRAIDIGANVGHYSLRLAKFFQQVDAFEINSGLTSELRMSGGNISVYDTGLSSREGNATLYIPILDSLPLVGWASLDPGNCPDTVHHQEKSVTIKTLDSFQFNEVDFIKIDVEGHEMDVLLGAIETLMRCKPRILIEIRKNEEKRVRALLNDLGYEEFPRNAIPNATPWNLCFRPR